MSDLFPRSETEIFRNDRPAIIARNRHLASIFPVTLSYEATGYAAGTVLARNTTSGIYGKYDDSGSSGLDTAVGILFHDVKDAPSGNVAGAAMIVRGEVFEAKLTGLDANAKTDLGSRSIVSGTGDTILIF
jgi:hypothetical protein